LACLDLNAVWYFSGAAKTFIWGYTWSEIKGQSKAIEREKFYAFIWSQRCILGWFGPDGCGRHVCFIHARAIPEWSGSNYWGDRAFDHRYFALLIALAVLANPAPWKIAAMFIVMGALVRTGGLKAFTS
jgi:hypothetical protein